MAGAPTQIAGYFDNGQPETPRMLVAVYRRDQTIYRFEGYER